MRLNNLKTIIGLPEADAPQNYGRFGARWEGGAPFPFERFLRSCERRIVTLDQASSKTESSGSCSSEEKDALVHLMWVLRTASPSLCLKEALVMAGPQSPWGEMPHSWKLH